MGNERKFEIGDKAKELFFSVMDLTTNRSHYPTKFRRLADQLQSCAYAISADVTDANGLPTDSSRHREKRFDLQTSAVSNCNKLIDLTEYSLHANLISAATSEAWIGLIHDVKYMTLAWRKV